MFDLTNEELIKKLINQRREDEVVFPLYVQIYNNRYSLLELDQIKIRFTPGVFKVGFGTADALFMKNSFPINRANEFDVVSIFMEYDDENSRNVRYTVFETSDIEHDASDSLATEIHGYVEMLCNHVTKQVDDHIKQLLQSE